MKNIQSELLAINCANYFLILNKVNKKWMLLTEIYIAFNVDLIFCACFFALRWPII